MAPTGCAPDGTSYSPLLGLAHEENGGIEIVHQLNENEYENYASAIRAVRRLSLQQQYALVERNYRRLRTIRSYFEAGFNQGTLNTSHYESVLFSYNSEMVNWLSSALSFLDHNNQALEHEHADSPDKIRAYRAATNKEYSQSAAYRISYSLRHYTLHCAFPVKEVETFLRNGVDRSNGVVLCLWLNRDLLLNDHFHWKAAARKDLESLPEKFEFDLMADEFMECLRRLHWTLIDDQVRGIASIQPVIKEAYDRVFDSREQSGCASLVRCDYAEDGRSFQRIERSSLPIELSNKAVETTSGDGRPSDFVRELAESSGHTAAAQYNDEILRSLEVGTAVMAAYLSDTSGVAFAHNVNNLIEEHDDVTPVIKGIAAIANVSLQMSATMHGTSPEGILGSLTYHARAWAEGGESARDEG